MPLGYHSQRLHAGARASIIRAQAPLLKIVDDWPDDLPDLVRAAGVKTLILRRWADDQANFQPTPEANAQAFFGQWRDRLIDLQQTLPLSLDWYIEEPWNERGQANEEELSVHARGSVEWITLCRSVGVRPAVGNFSVGNPPEGIFAAYRPALKALQDHGHGLLTFHDYWRPELARDAENPYHATYLVARWARLLTELHGDDYRGLAIALSEFGVDNGVYTQQLGGWRQFSLATFGVGDESRRAAAYAAQLVEALAIEREYAGQLGVALIGATVFCCGTPDTAWDSFDVAGVAEIEIAVRACRDWPPEPSPEPSPEPTPTEPTPMFVTQAFTPYDGLARRELHPWPHGWTQLDDWSFDADGDQGRANNCGPEAIAAAIKYLTGVELSADVTREMLTLFFGASQTEYTQTGDLAAWLRRFAEVEVEVHAGDASTLLQPVVVAAIDQGFPVVVLFAWDYARFAATGHFMPVVGYTDEGAICHQVWGGGRVFADWKTFEAWQKFGQAFVLRRRRDAQLGA